MREPIEVLALIGGDLTVVGWTRAAERMWGYSAADVVNRPAMDLLAPPADPVATDVFTPSRPWSGPVGIRRSDGREAEVEIRITPLRGGDGEEDWFVWSGEPEVWPGMKPSVLNALFERSPIGVAVWDKELRCTWINSSATDEGIFPSGSELGRPITEQFATEHPVFLETAMRQVLEDGVPLLDQELGPLTAARPDAPHFSVSFFRLDDAQGRAVGLCSMAVNVRDSQSRERLSLLSAAGTRIGTTLDPMHTAQELADTAVPVLADYVTVDLAEAVRPGEEPLEHLDSTDVSVPVFYRAGAASLHADMRESLWGRGTPVFVPPSSPFTTVLGSRRSHFEPTLDISAGTWLDADPDRARVIRATGMHSLMVVPLQARGAMLGVAVFVRTENPAPFTRADLTLAEGLCDRAALSLDSALRYTRERETALALQRDLLPHHLRGGSSVEVASRYLPSDKSGGVGGDWYDVILLPDARVALVVGDVVGHGINAAAAMGRLRTVVHTLTNLLIPPAELLARLDELVIQLAEEQPDDTAATMIAMAATCLYVIYDPATRLCTMASAGHPPPAIISPDGTVAFADVPPGPPIGVGMLEFESVETELAEGSVIALYTDGLIETRSGTIDEGLDRLREALTQAPRPLDELCAAVVETMVAAAPSEDDVTLLLARTVATNPDSRA
ncbi:SpoIIE family protein phosphatase [Streptomyces sp. NPDC005318]|uniref:SpoIIE family protein phosphatase n=1 Tax=Streptomyces sp. NPDC005318 TaxID=3157031 RepID=UPI00339E3DDE